MKRDSLHTVSLAQVWTQDLGVVRWQCYSSSHSTEIMDWGQSLEEELQGSNLLNLDTCFQVLWGFHLSHRGFPGDWVQKYMITGMQDIFKKKKSLPNVYLLPKLLTQLNNLLAYQCFTQLCSLYRQHNTIITTMFLRSMSQYLKITRKKIWFSKVWQFYVQYLLRICTSIDNSNQRELVRMLPFTLMSYTHSHICTLEFYIISCCDVCYNL